MDNFVTKVCSLPPTITSLCPMAKQTWSESMLSVSSAEPGSGKKELKQYVIFYITARVALCMRKWNHQQPVKPAFLQIGVLLL